jgi:hypothetical protein
MSRILLQGSDPKTNGRQGRAIHGPRLSNLQEKRLVGLFVRGPIKDHHPVPRLAHENGRYALMVDGAPYMMLGAQVNNSSAWPALLPKVWPAIEFLHANTVEMPVY